MTAPFFHPAPRFSPTAQLTETGVVLGETVLAPLSRRANGAAELEVSGREAEIFALLSLARGRAIHKNVLHGLHGVAKSLAQGDNVGAAIRLAQIGLPPLRGPRDAEMLKTGAIFLAKGVSPWTILQAAGIEGANVQLFKAEWDESLHPRDPTGRFAETGGTKPAANASRNNSSPWSSAIDAASQWLQSPVPEYDQDTGEQVGTRPRWRAIATSPIVVGAIGAAALLGGEALLAPAAEAGENALVSAAKADQVQWGYTADEWGTTQLSAGDKIYGGLPGQSAYYTDAETVAAAQGSRTSLFESLQVAPHPEFGYRPTIGEYEVINDLAAPSGAALANPNYGAGGGKQFFIGDFSNILRLVRKIQLEE